MCVRQLWQNACNVTLGNALLRLCLACNSEDFQRSAGAGRGRGQAGGRGQGAAHSLWRAVCLEGISVTVFPLLSLLLLQPAVEGRRVGEKSVTIAAAQFSERCPLAFIFPERERERMREREGAVSALVCIMRNWAK